MASVAAQSTPRDDTQPAVLVVRAGTVHPVSGPAIEDGVVVVRDGRIEAVGKASEVEVPEGARVLSFPDGHVYPGLIDAMSHAFGEGGALADRGTDAGMSLASALDATDRLSQELIDWGITTVYVSNRGETTWRGQGTVLHPGHDGFQVVEGEHAPVAMRISGGDANAHPLQRQKALRDVGKPFEELTDWREKQKKRDEALEKYHKDFTAWLDWYHQHGKNGETKPGDESEPPADESGNGDAAGQRGRRGRWPRSGEGQPPRGRGGNNGNGEPPQPTTQEPAKQGEDKPADDGAKGDGDKSDKTEKKDEPPKRPDYPAPLPPAPDKEALQQVLDGERMLHVEARRRDEITAALAMREEQHVPKMVLECGDEAAALADRIAKAGVPVVVTSVLPTTEPERDAPDLGALPAALHRAGATFAIASDGVRSARDLPLMAAYAAGEGLPADEAVAAITLRPAEILGIAKDVGSLEAGKRADLLVTTAPLLHSDARVALVVAGGHVEHRADQDHTEREVK